MTRMLATSKRTQGFADCAIREYANSHLGIELLIVRDAIEIGQFARRLGNRSHHANELLLIRIDGLDLKYSEILLRNPATLL